ncbi:gamma-aminobutyric acid type B receptor subunit 1 [Caerostris extrusa]|uniref:Gamma-aminobutyric acid type B receptor subunit 1 n=1 Tax=Caerostris extrusa TaxID=172846 RepID=A0AAV4VPV0_CAEEX|nr:gamma-aminobutyric acid type B receptor subunit 1 [Caerostris extrusa]
MVNFEEKWACITMREWRIMIAVSFLSDPTDAIRNVLRQDARIIVGMFYVAAAEKVLCEAYWHKMYGRHYVWFLIGWYEDDWYLLRTSPQLHCSANEGGGRRSLDH